MTQPLAPPADAAPQLAAAPDSAPSADPPGFWYQLRTNKGNLALLFLLYLAQGMPFGLAHAPIKALFTHGGASLFVLGNLAALDLPWTLKALLGPVVDRFYSARFGRRRSWILPMQALCLASIVLALFVGTTNLTALFAVVFVMNLFAAAQDLPVDGLALDVLKPHALGLGNTMQVLGFKLGAAFVSGVLFVLVATHGWDAMFLGMAAVSFLPIVPLLFYRERPISAAEGGVAEGAERPKLREIFGLALGLLTNKSLRWALLLVFTGKFGESVASSMYIPYLIKHGFTDAQIGTYITYYGMPLSLLGSFLGGLLIAYTRPWTALGVTVFLRFFPIAMQCWLFTHDLTASNVILVTALESLTGGAVTTALFSYMMSLVNKKAGATEYSVLCSLEACGKFPAGLLSGAVASAFGMVPTFLLGLACAGFTLIPWWKARNIAGT